MSSTAQSKVNDVVISVRDVSKHYKLYPSHRDRLKEALHPFKKKYHREFCALKNISFNISRGETVGIIGRNGSGKSTLLKIICSVLKPTTGEVKVNGRISSLLELGGGFNQEFTGRENVVINAQIMGFTASQMKKRLPEIEAFAEIGEFIDQPVKTYSSGMFVRLAFAAAINVDPDILIIDEALAVGDAKFQHKCYNKFLEFQKAGKTIVFVTHDMRTIAKHCDSAILIDSGSVFSSGRPNEVVNNYSHLILDRKSPAVQESGRGNEEASSSRLEKESSSTKERLSELEIFLSEKIIDEDRCLLRKNYNKNEYRYGDRRAAIVDFLIVSNGKYYPAVVKSNDWVDIYFKVKFYEAVESPNSGFKIKTIDGVVIYGTNAILEKFNTRAVSKNEIVVYKFSLKCSLVGGDYFIDLGVGDKQSSENAVPIERRYDVIHITVEQTDQFGMVDLECSMCECAPLPDAGILTQGNKG